MDEIVCDGCQARMSTRQLHATTTANATTTVREVCPHCRTLYREETKTSRESITSRVIEDAEAIESWLARESEESPRVVAGPPRADLSVRRWQVRGALPPGTLENWSLEVEYHERQSMTFLFRIVATESGDVRSEIQPLIAVFAGHGLQPHATASTDYDFSRQAGGNSTTTTSWGAEQVLSTIALPTGLLRGVVARLVGAMRDAVTTRNRSTT